MMILWIVPENYVWCHQSAHRQCTSVGQSSICNRLLFLCWPTFDLYACDMHMHACACAKSTEK